MKKTLMKLVSLILIALTLASCGSIRSDPSSGTTESAWDINAEMPSVRVPDPFVSPEDEIRTEKRFTSFGGGLRMDVILYGYASESLGMDFYLKSHERAAGRFEITNYAEISLSQVGPYPPDHLIFEDHIADPNGNRLYLEHRTASDDGYLCELMPDQTVTKPFSAVIGHITAFSDTVQTFSGTCSFRYTDIPIVIGGKNTEILDCPISVTVVYTGKLDVVSAIVPEDEVKTAKTFEAISEDGLVFRVIFNGYASESLGMDFYLKSHEPIACRFEIENTSDTARYQFSSPASNPFWISHLLTNQYKNALTLTFSTGSADILWPHEIPPGETVGKDMTAYAGDLTYDEDYIELSLGTQPGRGEYGYDFFDKSVYVNSRCTFSGTCTFAYDITAKTIHDTSRNEKEIVCEITLDFLYVPDIPAPSSSNWISSAEG